MGVRATGLSRRMTRASMRWAGPLEGIQASFEAAYGRAFSRASLPFHARAHGTSGILFPVLSWWNDNGFKKADLYHRDLPEE